MTAELPATVGRSASSFGYRSGHPPHPSEGLNDYPDRIWYYVDTGNGFSMPTFCFTTLLAALIHLTPFFAARCSGELLVATASQGIL